MKKFFFQAIILALLPLAFAFVSCGGSSAVEVLDVGLSRERLTLMPGSEYKLSSVIEPAGAASKVKLSWSSSSPGVATVSYDGTVKGQRQGTATITATSPNGKSASCAITVPDVYVVGNIGTELDSFSRIVRLWANGEAHDLVDLTATHGVPAFFRNDYAFVGSVRAFNNDVYVAGQVTNLQDIDVATLWINGRTYELGDGVIRSGARSVCILGNGDAYVAGNIDGGATLWKVDGRTRGIQAIYLGINGRPLDIVISGGRAYLTGYVSPGVHNIGNADPMFWEFDLEARTVRAYHLPCPGGATARSVAVSDAGDVYIVGEDASTGIVTALIAKLWKVDGLTKAIQSIDLDGSHQITCAWDVAVSGNGDVYAAGEIGISEQAKLWKIDGQTLRVTELLELPGGRSARSLFLFGEDDLFVAGYGRPIVPTAGSTNSYSPKYWKIDLKTPRGMPNVETRDLPYAPVMQMPSSIFVK